MNDKCDEELVELVLNSIGRIDPQKNWKEIVKYAEINGVIIPILRYLKKEGLDSEFEFVSLFNNEIQKYNLFWHNIFEIDQIFSEEGIEYAIIKTKRIYEFYNWDINILIRQKDWSKALRVLNVHGWKKGVFLSHPLALIEPDKLLLERKNSFPIHLHRRISWHGLEYLPSELILSSKSKIKGIYYPNESIDALICCAHSVFENYKLNLGEIYNFMKTTNDSTHDYLLSLANENKWLKGARLAIKTIKEIWSLLKNGAELKLPYKYRFKSLLKAWNEHAWKKGFGLYEICVNSVKYLLQI